MKTIKLNGWEYTTEDLQKGKMFSEIKIPKGWELWDYNDCIKLFNSNKKELNLINSWFFIEQSIKEYKDKYVARFYSYSVGTFLLFDGFPASSDSVLGVRFKRKVK